MPSSRCSPNACSGGETSGRNALRSGRGGRSAARATGAGVDAHAQADVVWPCRIPTRAFDHPVRLDGSRQRCCRDDLIGCTLRAVHRVEVDYVPDGEPAHRVSAGRPRRSSCALLGSGDWSRRGCLVGDTLELVPPRAAASAARDDADPVEAVSEAIPAFVKVQRSFVLDQRWEMAVQVTRVAPSRSGINIAIPLLGGEQPFQNAPPIRDGRAIVSLPAGVDSVEWRSRLAPVPTLKLTAGTGRDYAEEWRLLVAPLLHVEVRGLPESGQEVEHTDGGVRRFLRCGGVDRDRCHRPEAFPVRVSQSETRHAQRDAGPTRPRGTLLRAAFDPAGQHAVTLPPAVPNCSAARIDGESQPLVMDGGPVAHCRCAHKCSDRDRLARNRWGRALHRNSAWALGASASKLRLGIAMPDDSMAAPARWPRRRSGGADWGELLVMLMAAVSARPLRAYSTERASLADCSARFSTLFLVDASWCRCRHSCCVVLALAWRARRADLVERRIFPWLQLALLGFSASAADACDRGFLTTAGPARHECRR